MSETVTAVQPDKAAMEKINLYTRRAYKPEEVYTFSVVLCDNEVDRDGECFTKETLEELAKLFVGYDEGLYTLTCHAFRLFSFAFLFAGFNIFASSFFTALGNGLISAAISFLRTLVFQTASVFILPLIFDVDGIWYAITVAEVFATLISVIFLFAKRKKYHYMECSPHGKK